MSDGERLDGTGGMVGGGIYAVPGVVTGIAGAATWLAFLLAGVVAACAAYSCNRLNALSDGQGGSVTFVQSFTGNATLAGMVGWTLLVGYVGSMAMYAFASLSFVVVFGAMSYLAFRQRDRDAVRGSIPLVGTVGAGGFFPLLFYHFSAAERGTFYAVLVVAAAVFAVELLYFELLYFERETFDEYVVPLDSGLASGD